MLRGPWEGRRKGRRGSVERGEVCETVEGLDI